MCDTIAAEIYVKTGEVTIACHGDYVTFASCHVWIEKVKIPYFDGIDEGEVNANTH